MSAEFAPMQQAQPAHQGAACWSWHEGLRQLEGQGFFKYFHTQNHKEFGKLQVSEL